MKEDLLQYIWKFRYFNTSELTGCKGERIEIVKPGIQNFNQGPDFLNARIRINDTLWVGNVELHISSRQWNQHGHQNDENYNNVILHVVWRHDGDVTDKNGTVLPTLVLEDRVSKTLLSRYRTLMEKEYREKIHFIACEKLIRTTPLDPLKMETWKSRLVAERLERKTRAVLSVLDKTGYHWDETMWIMMAANFGGSQNKEIFQRIAETVPQNILARHKNQLIAIEAILFGQASLLNEDFEDPYPKMLRREYAFYLKKYHFQKVDGNVLFGRMRPANFPTIRLAQLSALVCKSSHLFSRVKDFETVKEAKDAMTAAPNDYWLYHYKLKEEAASRPVAKQKILGNQMIENIIINTICPILFAYGIYNNDQLQKEKAIDWLEDIRRENNAITRGFEQLGVANKNAFDSQALVQLKKNYCDQKRCLDCSIGNMILSRP